jgi:hypothetical protein
MTHPCRANFVITRYIAGRSAGRSPGNSSHRSTRTSAPTRSRHSFRSGSWVTCSSSLSSASCFRPRSNSSRIIVLKLAVRCSADGGGTSGGGVE